MALPALLLRINADVAGALKGLGSVMAQLAAAAAVAVSFGAALKKGFEINSETESATLGLKALVLAMYDVRDASGNLAKGPEELAIATGIAEEQMQKLRIAGLQTSATLKQLLGAYQQAVGAGASAGMSLDETLDLTVGITMAASALGLSMDQLNQEVRSLVSGDITSDSTVANAMQISGEQVKLWKEKGTLVAELNTRLEAYKRLGPESAKTWTATLSNMGDAFDMFLGKTTKGAFDELKGGLQSAMAGVFDMDTGGVSDKFEGLASALSTMFSGVGTVLADILEGAIALAENLSGWFSENQERLYGWTTALSVIYDSLKSIVSTVIGVLGELFLVTAESFEFKKALDGVAIILALIQDGFTLMKIGIQAVGGFIIDKIGGPLRTVLNSLLNFVGQIPIIGSALADGIGAALRALPKDGKALTDSANASLASFKAGNTALAETQRRLADNGKTARDAAAAAAAAAEKAKKTGGTATPKKPPPKKDDGKAKKDSERAAKAYEDALKSYEDAKASADKKLSQVVHTAAVRDLETSLKERLITQEKYLADKSALDLKENALDLAAARKREAALQKEISGETDPAKRQKLEGDLLKLRADIAEIEDKGMAIPVALKLDLAAFKETVESLRIDIKADILDANGLPYEAALKRLAKKTEDLLKDDRVRGDAGLTADVTRAAEQQKDKLALEESKRLMDDKASYFSLAQQRIARDVEMGRITQTDAEKAVQAERQKTIASIEAYIVVLARLAAAYPDNKDFALNLAQAREQLAAVGDEANKTGVALYQAFASGITGALKEMLTTAKSATDVIKGLFFKLFDAIAAKALEKLTAQLFAGLAGGGGGAMGGVGTFIGGAAKFLGFADGGHVRGAGTGTSDSIPAWLSNGEFVLKASTVRKFGTGFLNALNAGYMPRAMPRFADGGAVGLAGAGGGGGAPQVTVQNNNQANLYLDPAQLASKLGREPQFGRDIIRIVMENKGKLGLAT